MENLFIIILIALAVLAIADLIVGVSNDAVNFLNSAVGSKAISFRSILIVASIGVAIGAIFSSGMMEVARKGIFNPGEFYFEEIMFIFLAVMITDVLLLDFFNTIGMPTSTTVSIVFELLGAAVFMAAFKVFAADGTAGDILNYINKEKAITIVSGILLSVVISFSVGAIIQWLARLLLSYNFHKMSAALNAIFGGVAITSIVYFILMKGLGGTSFESIKFAATNGLTLKEFLENNVLETLLANFVLWSSISFLLIQVFKINIYKVIIAIGTFSLALAFAGNDLVNFIGVPIAAFQSYEAWAASGIAADAFTMDVLAKKVPTPTTFLLISGIIMVLTLLFSKKARTVADTEISLARENDGKEKFKPNYISRAIVRGTSFTANYFARLVPEKLRYHVDARFQRPTLTVTLSEAAELPAFDQLRAVINLVVSGVLIALATSLKLPLSTTYVTFMVAMGTSLADRAWGADSAVYRVAGVLNVIAGWFGTAIIAFIVSGLILSAIFLGREFAIFGLLLLSAAILIRNYIVHKRKDKSLNAEDTLTLAESRSKEGIIKHSTLNISKLIKRSNKLYTNAVKGLATQDLTLLKKNKKGVQKLVSETEELKDNIYYFIKNLDASGVTVGKQYLSMLNYLIDITQSLDHLCKITYRHVQNNHKPLKYAQLKELKQLNLELEAAFLQIINALEKDSTIDLSKVFATREMLLSFIAEKLDAQIQRTRTEESSPKNTTLYFDILLESKDLVKAMMNLLEMLQAAKEDIGIQLQRMDAIREANNSEDKENTEE